MGVGALRRAGADGGAPLFVSRGDSWEAVAAGAADGADTFWDSDGGAADDCEGTIGRQGCELNGVGGAESSLSLSSIVLPVFAHAGTIEQQTLPRRTGAVSGGCSIRRDW